MSTDTYLKVQLKRSGKVKGEATAPEHEEDMLVRSWNWGAAASSALGAGAQTARRSYRSLMVVKNIDNGSTALLAALAKNDEVREAKLSMRKSGAGQQDYFTITLKLARITAVDYESDESGSALERVTLTFSKVDVEYWPQLGTGQRGAACTFSDEI